MQSLDNGDHRDICYGLFVPRSDGSIPKSGKLLEDRIYWSLESATSAASEMAEEFMCKIEVRELSVCVGRPVLVAAWPVDIRRTSCG